MANRADDIIAVGFLVSLLIGLGLLAAMCIQTMLGSEVGLLPVTAIVILGVILFRWTVTGIAAALVARHQRRYE